MKTFSNNVQLTLHERFHKSNIIPQTIKTTENKLLQFPCENKVPIEIIEKFHCKHCDKTYDTKKNLQEHSQTCKKDFVDNKSIKDMPNIHSMEITEDAKNIDTVNALAVGAITNGRRRLRNAANDVKYSEDKSYSDISDDEDSRKDTSSINFR